MELDLEKIKWYREGHVVNEEITEWNCRTPAVGKREVFHYIELVQEDGNRKFVYEDKEGYQRFEQNFHARRFTSFHEFWTTEMLAEEERGELSFAYYVRRGEEDYLIMPLNEMKELLCAREQQKQCFRLPDRITEYGRYDRRVNYHMQ